MTHDQGFLAMPGRTLLIGLALLLAPGPVKALEDEHGVYVLTKPEHTMEQVEKAAAEVGTVRIDPPADRWANLPRTAEALEKGGDLRVVMLGDSIVNDTSRSRWEDVLAAMWPKARISKVTVVRGGTGCWWYKEEGRVGRYVIGQEPDLLIIGGISHKEDVDSVRDVVRQVRAGSTCDILLMTGAFGTVDPRDDRQWSFAIDPEGKDYRARLRKLAADEKAGSLDMTAYWGKFVRDSDKELKWFKRDDIHANERGEQVIGRILAGFLAPPVKRD
jgi:hypothetical protein